MKPSSPLLVGVVLLRTLTVPATGAEPKLLWEVHLNGNYPVLTDATTDLAVDKSGNLFVAGTTSTVDGLRAAFFGKYTKTGEEPWTGIFMQSGRMFTRGKAVALDRIGQPIVIGTTAAVEGSMGQMIVMKWSTLGNFLFSALINQPEGTEAEAIAVAVDAWDNFYVAANHSPQLSPGAPAEGTTRLTNGYLRKYSPTGEPLWAVPLNHPDAQSTQINTMSVDQAGHVALAGRAVLTPPATADASEEQTTYATFKVSPEGALEWSDLFARSTRGDNHVTAIATDAQGAVYVTGSSSSPHSATLTDVTTLKYTATGTRAWVSHFDAIEQANTHLGVRSFAATSLAIGDEVWVGCTPYLLLRLSTFNGSDWGMASAYYGADSGVDATIDRLLLLERGRGMLHCGSISDATGSHDLYVQHTDVSLNEGWSFRFHPANTQASGIVAMLRGAQDQVHFAANYSLAEGDPDGVLFTVAPPAVPSVQVIPLQPLAVEPSRPGRPGLDARFRIKLSTPAEQDLTVHYGFGGTAHWDTDEGADYVLPPNSGTQTIRKGRSSADIVVRPVADTLREPTETVILTLQATNLPTLNDYKLGRLTKATAWILDNTPPPRPRLLRDKGKP